MDNDLLEQKTRSQKGIFPWLEAAALLASAVANLEMKTPKRTLGQPCGGTLTLCMLFVRDGQYSVKGIVVGGVGTLGGDVLGDITVIGGTIECQIPTPGMVSIGEQNLIDQGLVKGVVRKDILGTFLS